MFISKISHLLRPTIVPKMQVLQTQSCHNLFSIKELLQPEKAEQFSVSPLMSDRHELAIDMVKEHYLPEHVLVKERTMNLNDDCAFDEYLKGLLRQGNSIYATADDGTIAGICINFASSRADSKKLRTFAFYRQDPDTKDFLQFTATLQETPNLWEEFNQSKIFEIKIMTVLPEYRRQGLATKMLEKARQLARDQAYRVVRFDCINPFDYKIAERCMMQCLMRFPVSRLRDAGSPFIKRRSRHNVPVSVYVNTRLDEDDDTDSEVKLAKKKMEKVLEK